MIPRKTLNIKIVAMITEIDVNAVRTIDFEPNFSGFSRNFYNIFQEERGSNQLTPWSTIDIICKHIVKLRIHWIDYPFGIFKTLSLDTLF
jgi:hypothetical protein